MNRTVKRKFVSLLLCFAMVVGMLPATVFAAERTVISRVVAVPVSGHIVPEYSTVALPPELTITEGSPATLPDSMYYWYKKVGGNWKRVEKYELIGEGTYRCEAQLRTDGAGYVLSSDNLSVVIDGMTWEKTTGVSVSDTFSYVFFASPEFEVTEPENAKLVFYNPGGNHYTVGENFRGHAIESFTVANHVMGGTKPYTFSKVSGPEWISVSAEGVVSGTPDVYGENESLVVEVTDGAGTQKKITIPVYRTDVKPADRTVVSSVVAVTDSNLNPTFGSQATSPALTVTTGSPAYFPDTMLRWQKYVDGNWENMSEDDKFDIGTYRYEVQVRIDKSTHVLARDGLTVTVNGENWDKTTFVTVDDTFSYVFVASPEFEVTRPSMVALDIQGIKTPVIGETADVSGITINNNNGITVSEAQWYKFDGINQTVFEKFEAGEEYILAIRYALEETYTVLDNANVMHNMSGGTAEHNSAVQMVLIRYTVPLSYKITVTTDGNGTASASSERAAEGEIITLTATPNEGYEFVKWNVTVPRNFRIIGNRFTMPASSVSVQAVFGEKEVVPEKEPVGYACAIVTEPEAGASPSFEIAVEGEGCTAELEWEIVAEETIIYPEDNYKFKAGEEYALWVVFTPKDGYEFADDATITINGMTPDDMYEYEGNIVCLVTYTIPAAEPVTYAKVSDITEPAIGATPDFDITLTGDGVAFDEEEGIGYAWFKVDPEARYWELLDEDTPFEAGLYALRVSLKSEAGHKFTDDTRFYFGEKELPEYDGSYESNYDCWSDGADICLYFTLEDKPLTPLAVPTVTASNIAATGKIQLKWTAVEGADKYEVWRATSKAGEYDKIYTTTGTSLKNTSVKAGETWWYSVRAICEADSRANSEPSAPVGRTVDLPQPVVTATNIASTGKIQLKWDAIEGAKEYKVYRSTTKDGEYKLLKTTTATSLKNTSVNAGETYYYKVMAVHATSAVNSAYSTAVGRTVDLPQPVASIALNSKGKPRVTWNAVSGAKEYEVYRATSSSGTYTKLYTTTGTSMTNSSATAGKTYYYKVKAVHTITAANSAFSTVKSITSK